MKPMPTSRQQLGWTCGKGHFHLTEAVAQRCADAPPKVPQRRWTPEMVADVVNRHNAGESYRSIGVAYGITASTARGVFERDRFRKMWEQVHGEAKK